MTSRNWVKLFISTLLIGGLATGVTGFIVRWAEFARFFKEFNIIEILAILFWLIGVGFIFSLLSQAGFFAYLTIHRFGLGIFKSVKLWNAIQVVLIGIVLFDLVYLRYELFAADNDSLLPYIGLMLLVLIPGLIVAYLKARQTNKSAFIPALFFMIVVTVLEWVPILRVNEESWVYLMIFPLLICNAYQLLMLTKINEKSLEERKSIQLKTNKPTKKPSNA
ncbi:KinB-signaling pathway activation protein [Mesobacillus persicus]|uniref:KinB-signaling pathway activation protein n=1 Tax=Mesobacillus persicus TaxID=930146 RepID=UPI000B829911|nr:KinB-signaling pathway activation protein [Mesobacillus persicus]